MSAQTMEALRPRFCWNLPINCAGRSAMDTVFGLLWTDGEEAEESWNMDNDAYTARSTCAELQADGPTRRFKSLLVADMIGDADLNIEREANSARGWKT